MLCAIDAVWAITQSRWLFLIVGIALQGFRRLECKAFTALFSSWKREKNFIALKPLTVLQSEPSNIHVLPFTPLLVSVVFSRSSRKGNFWCITQAFHQLTQRHVPPIFPIPINDKRSLWTKTSLISDEVEVVQQARGIFFGLWKLLLASKVLCSTRSQIFIFRGTAWHRELVRKLHRSPNCLHANTVSCSSLLWTYGWKLAGINSWKGDSDT